MMPHAIDGSAMNGIAEWLASIGLSESAQRFADNAIDLSVVRDLTDQTSRTSIGVSVHVKDGAVHTPFVAKPMMSPL
jgi:hypothetical protein